MIDPESVDNKALSSLDPDAPENGKRRVRSMLRDQNTAIAKGWVKPGSRLWDKIYENAERLQDAPEDRVAIRASELALNMYRAMQAQAEQEDKAARLDAGEATENVGIRIVYKEAPDS